MSLKDTYLALAPEDTTRIEGLPKVLSAIGVDQLEKTGLWSWRPDPTEVRVWSGGKLLPANRIYEPTKEHPLFGRVAYHKQGNGYYLHVFEN